MYLQITSHTVKEVVSMITAATIWDRPLARVPVERHHTSALTPKIEMMFPQLMYFDILLPF
jgi:hypothetical protein